jgi:D-beta-D-heptose 7-phosphate kinase/D-beta-D-heptose 1-phosphate adenosyltransferase
MMTLAAKLHRVPGSQTINKLRVLSRHKQLIRNDFEDHFPTWEPCLLLKSFQAHASTAQVAILSDYAKDALRSVPALIAHARSIHLPVIIDPKGKDFEPYRGATLLTPNLSEFEAVVGQCASEDDINTRAHNLRQALGLHALLVTRSEEGMSLFQAGTPHPPLRLPTHAREVFDVTGAGGTVVAVLGAGLAAGLDMASAVQLANVAAGVVVGEMGTVGVSVGVLQGAFINSYLIYVSN